MSKKNKKKKLNKTLIEKMLDQQKIPYKQLQFATVQKGDVKQMDTSILDDEEALVYRHLSMKKLAKASGNKKCELLPLKKLVATTGYVHGANTPIGIYQKHHFPIYLDSSMKEHDQIAVSSGEVGRSIMINPDDLQKVTNATFVDLLE